MSASAAINPGPESKARELACKRVIENFTYHFQCDPQVISNAMFLAILSNKTTANFSTQEDHFSAAIIKIFENSQARMRGKMSTSLWLLVS